MGIAEFNRGMDDAFQGSSPRRSHIGNTDYIDGYEYGKDINKEIEYEDAMKREYEEHMKRQIEEDFFKEAT